MEYNIIVGGPVGVADVEAVFGRWGRVCPLDGGAVDVVIGDCGFVIAPEASLSVNPAFVRWVAHARGFGGSAHVYSAEIDESYLESEGEETEVSRQVEAGLARLAERVGGVYAPFFQGDAISYTDPVGGEYDFAGGPSQWDRKRKPGSPALHLSWYGRPGPQAAPLEQWADSLERHLPQCCPLRRPAVEPVVGGGAL
ncbi:pyridoxal-5-phosphate-dependent enzyme, partial [Schaalia georgiae]